MLICLIYEAHDILYKQVLYTFYKFMNECMSKKLFIYVLTGY